MTVFVYKVMMILENELDEGYLTKQEYDDYMNLFHRAAEKIFEKHADLIEEVDRMTKPMIELPSVLQKRLWAEIDTLVADRDALIADKDALIADKDALIADKDALIAANGTLAADLADKNALLADKDAELDRMRALLEQYHIPVTA